MEEEYLHATKKHRPDQRTVSVLRKRADNIHLVQQTVLFRVNHCQPCLVKRPLTRTRWDNATEVICAVLVVITVVMIIAHHSLCAHICVCVCVNVIPGSEKTQTFKSNKQHTIATSADRNTCILWRLIKSHKTLSRSHLLTL